MNFCRNNSTVLTIVVVVLIAIIIGVVVYRTRDRVMGEGGPYADIIRALSDANVKADAQELQYLYQIAKRPNIQSMIQDTIKSLGRSSGKTRVEDHGTYEVFGMNTDEALASGGFERV